MKNLFQLIDIENENVGLYESEKSAQELEKFVAEWDEAEDGSELDDFLNERGFDRIFAEAAYTTALLS